MKQRFRVLMFCLSFSMVVFATAQRAWATLGESADSVESDRKVLSAVRGAITTNSGYTVHEVSGATTVREYVSPTGIVFAIVWNGLVHPDLTLLLGAYATEYHEALRQTLREKGVRRLGVKSNRVVVEKWGHRRNLQGRAYAPELIPPGVSVDEVK
jgi:hypothetical protein